MYDQYADRCYECMAYGDDYYYDESINEYVSSCIGCPYSLSETEDDWDD